MDISKKIQIFYGDIRNPSEEDWIDWLRGLPWDNRKKQTDRFVKTDDKKRCIGAGVLLRRVLALYHIEDMRLGQNAYGKPHLLAAHMDAEGDEDHRLSDHAETEAEEARQLPVPENPIIFEFNLSHSGDYVLCAAGPYPVGVDVEQWRHGDPKVAEHFFTENEYNWIMASAQSSGEPDGHRDYPVYAAGDPSKLLLRRSENEPDNLSAAQKRFIRLWTLKESYCKLKGLGLSLSLSDFEILPDSGLYPEGLAFVEFDLPGHHAAVCSPGEIEKELHQIF